MPATATPIGLTDAHVADPDGNHFGLFTPPAGSRDAGSGAVVSNPADMLGNGVIVRQRARAALVALAVVLSGFVAVPRAKAVEVGDATLSLPPDGARGHALWDSYHELEPFGYEEQEYFVSGTASDAAGNRAPYTTRIIVTRPSDAKRFNGTVMLDWVNVTAQFENAVDTMEARQMLLREGFAWVHVSAQAAGVCCTPLTPKVWDPVRYAALSHPGDEFSDDMFAQIAKAVRAPVAKGSIDPMDGLHTRYVLAAGQSQSGGKLRAFLATPYASAGVIDGFLVHGSAADKKFASPLPAKVIHLLSDAEADPSAPPADPNYRLWEVAGTAHSDFFIGYQSVFGLGLRTVAGAPKLTKAQYDDLMRTAGNYGEQLHPMLATCVLAGATMPMRYAVSSAIYQLDRWVKAADDDGFSPENGPRFEFDGGARATDEYRNTRGGIRLPPVDVPVARYETEACGLGGLTIPFTDVELLAKYGDHGTYAGLMRSRTDAAVREGWLLPEDAVDLMARACWAANRFPLSTPGCTEPYSPPRWNTT